MAANLSEREGRRRLRYAFQRMRRAGLVAHQAYKCCTSCGTESARDECRLKPNIVGLVFYHSEDAAHLSVHGDVYLAFEGYGHDTVAIGRMVCEHITAVGLTYEWPLDDPEARILVRVFHPDKVRYADEA
jgi:hypothetical protein